jgi:tetrapyrrole methylase family protein / MazG family protein
VTAGPIHIVGLGPGAPEHLTLRARELLMSGLPIILRTRHHPTVATLSAGFSDCDDLYANSPSFDDVYRAVAARVLAAAQAGEVIYAVPGHPLVAERSVTHLLAEARPREIPTVVHPAVSFVDLAAVALRMDLERLQLCDALDLRIDSWRPALIGQLYDRDSVTALKLHLLDIYPAGHTVTRLSALGTPEESVTQLPLAEIDHRPYGYLDSLFVPQLDPIDDVRRFDGFHYVIERLHAPDGCPWDREQTHESLRPHLLEESYEALEAIDRNDLRRAHRRTRRRAPPGADACRRRRTPR